jgi:hypothetical protein
MNRIGSAYSHELYCIFFLQASLTLTRAEKHPVLNEWFNSFHGLIRQQPFTPAMLADICAESITPHDAGAAPAARSAATESTSAAAPFTRLPLAAVPADSVHSPCDRSTPFALSMRHGFHTLAAELAAADVPTVVVSAGIGNFIVDALRYVSSFSFALDPRDSARFGV